MAAGSSYANRVILYRNKLVFELQLMIGWSHLRGTAGVSLQTSCGFAVVDKTSTRR